MTPSEISKEERKCVWVTTWLKNCDKSYSERQQNSPVVSRNLHQQEPGVESRRARARPQTWHLLAADQSGVVTLKLPWVSFVIVSLLTKSDKLFSANALCCSWWLTICGNGFHLAWQISPHMIVMQPWHFRKTPSDAVICTLQTHRMNSAKNAFTCFSFEDGILVSVLQQEQGFEPWDRTARHV